jgi:glycerophosphoryl diester phosphodiesterase
MAAEPREKKVFVWAHRGASSIAPENSMTAFRLAEAAGADGIELDVHLSRDGQPVVIHDETVDRTTSGHGAVADLTAAELRDLDAGAWFAAEFRGEPVPLLTDVLAWAESRIRLNIEIKTQGAGQAVLEALKDFPQTRALISSFNHKLLFRIRQADSNIPIGFLTDSRFWRIAARRAVTCAAESFHPPEKFVTRALVNWCHSHALSVYPWTVDPPARKTSLLRIGVDGFFTNLP